MANDELTRAALARRLLDEERDAHAAAAGDRAEERGRELVARLAAEEREFERRVRRVALGAWSVLLALVPLLAGIFYTVRVGGGAVVELARAAAVGAGILALLALPLAALTTVVWLFRSRSASLAAIDRRLGALEALLRESGASRDQADAVGRRPE